jgi:hypothetical protein
MGLDNFIVRIYRRDSKQPDHLAGEVEDIDHGRRYPFQTMEKLWRILAGEKPEAESQHHSTLNEQHPDGGRSQP